jgi:hypothetical protein
LNRSDDRPPRNLLEVLAKGIGRFALILLGLCALAVGVALVFFYVFDMSADRAFPLAFYLSGAFLAVGGFLGPIMGAGAMGSPQYTRMVEGLEADKSFGERLRAESRALVYGTFGVALISVGIVLELLL